jgi:hypothetical protein
MVKRLRAAVLVAATAAALGAVTAAPAQAASGYDRCPNGSYCMFSGLDGGGTIVTLTANAPDLRTQGIDKLGKSDWNRTGQNIWLYSDYDYGGCAALTSPAGKGNFFSSFRDFFSSVQIGGPGGEACQT